MTAHDLKPCPFCGGEARIETVNHDYGVTYSVGCFGSGRCGASFTLFDHRNDAIATWNRRTLSTITPAEVGWLVERLRIPWPPDGSGDEVTLPVWVFELMNEAATAIEAQAAELAAARSDALTVGDQMLAEKFRADNLSGELAAERAAHAETKRALDALGAFAFWFQKYPEFKPNPDMQAEMLADLDRARPFIPARRALEGGE